MFNWSISVGYFYVLRYLTIMTLENNENGLKKIQYLKFFKINDGEQLANSYPINKRDAKRFLRISDILVRITRVNVLLLCFFCICIHINVLITARNLLSAKAFLLLTIPNFIIFWISCRPGYQASNCFACIFILTCVFISKNIKSLSDYKYFYLIKKPNITEAMKNELIKFNLKSLNRILIIHTKSQRNFNITTATFYSFFLSLGFAFPYVIFGSSQNRYFQAIYFIGYVNGISISLGLIAIVNSLVDESVSTIIYFNIYISNN